uniref:Uncharacterized protein n=1 Tax=Aegilops tauschii subsp. strangulata TaxID=200361 RepID=A0A453TE23_AEGTS
MEDHLDYVCFVSFLTSDGSLSTCLQGKDQHMSYAQLAKDWLSKSDHILHMPFLDTAYSTALEAAEQFLWGD